MKTPEDRSCLFVQEILQLAEKAFEGSRFDCDRRRGSFQSCVAVTEVRIYDDLASHVNKFVPIAIVSIVDPENPKFQVKTRQADCGNGPLESKEYTAGKLEKGLIAQLKMAHTGRKDDAWLLLEHEFLKGIPARQKIPAVA